VYTDATLATVSADSGADQKAAAQAQVNSAISTITDMINGATAQVKTLAAAQGKAKMVKRQGISLQGIVDQIAALLLELSGTLNGIIAVLGLTGLLAFLNPLTSGLSGLILALALVVDGLLVAVGILLNTVLIGLSVALAGLTL
jgi:hypothetical protein